MGLKAQWFAGSLPYAEATGKGVRMKLHVLRTVRDGLGEGYLTRKENQDYSLRIKCRRISCYNSEWPEETLGAVGAVLSTGDSVYWHPWRLIDAR